MLNDISSKIPYFFNAHSIPFIIIIIIIIIIIKYAAC